MASPSRWPDNYPDIAHVTKNALVIVGAENERADHVPCAPPPAIQPTIKQELLVRRGTFRDDRVR